MPYKPGALVLTCSDGRLHQADHPYLAEYLRGKHIGITTWDLAAVHGGCRGLVTGDAAEKAFVLAMVQRAHEGRGVTNVILVNHSDCDVYGGLQAFGDATAEFRKHAEDLRAARLVLRQAIPNLDMRLVFASIEERPDGSFVTFDEVR